jgi:thiamine transporter ThiT
MKLTTGVKWGLVAGLVVGVLAGVLAYMSVMSILDALVEHAYQEMVKMGTPPAQARQAAELTRQIMPPSAFAGGVVIHIIIYLIVGLVMAAVWERLRLP